MFDRLCGTRFNFLRHFGHDRWRSFPFDRVFHNYCQERARHFIWHWLRPKAREPPGPPVLLCGGVVAFLWDKERISNEQIMNCVTDYLEQVSNNLPVSVSKSVGEADTFTVPTSPTSPSPSSSSSGNNSSWSVLNWFFTPSCNDTQMAGSGTRVCGDNGSTNYISRTLSLLSWSRSATPASRMEDPRAAGAVVDGDGLSAELIEDERKMKLMDVKRKRKAEFSRALRHHLKTHSEQNMSQLPLVGMVHRDGRRGLISGPRLVEHAYDITKTKILKLYDKKKLTSRLSDDGYLENLSSCIASGGSESDLACIEETLHSCQQYQSDDLYKLYMMVDWGTQPMEIPDPSHNSGTKWLDTEKRLIPRLLRLKSQLESIRTLLSLNLDYFQEEFLIEAHFANIDPTLIHGAVRDVVDAGKNLYSKVLKLSPSIDKPNCDNPGKCISKEVLAFNVTLDQPSLTRCLNVSAFRSTGLHERSVELSVITGELAKIVSSVPSHSVSVDSRSKKDTPEYLLGWECINKGDFKFMVYRKLYKDTGLFQYKVIGHYDDITAQDFLDVQVDHDLRKDWDENARDLVVLDSDYRSNCKLIHWIMKYPFPMHSREYVFVQRAWTSDNNDIIVIMNRAASHPDVKDTGKHVRVSDYFSDMIIKARSSISEPGMHFELTYYDNPRTNLPSSCISWVTFSALPDFMSKLHAAAYSKQKAAS